MEVQNWRIFNKEGSPINWYRDSYLNLDFVTDAQNAGGAEAYAVTDPSGVIDSVVVTNSGIKYDPNNTSVLLSYTFDETGQSFLLNSSEASIGFKDVSIFDPEGQNVKGVESVEIDLSTAFIYPSVAYTGSIFLKPVSQGLVETEHLTIVEDVSGGWIRPYDASNSTLVFKMAGNGDDEIQLFDIDEETQTIVWSDEIVYDISTYAPGFPLTVNIGFRSEEEGVYERRLRVYHRIGGQDLFAAEFVINAESEGYDERFNTLLTNFGLPNPIDFPKLFKETDINEDLPDYKVVNPKGKNMILDHSEIMPFIGTYKALINAIKWLGYEDIKVKEWFRNVKERKKLSLYVPYEAEDRTKTLLYFSPEERRNLKKLNQLSLVYCINRETGEVDEWGNPITENCYEYNLKEIQLKLYSLKQWLERYIIGVNARITDITGEGVYFERFQNFLYGTQNIGVQQDKVQTLTPDTIGESSELYRGDASVLLTLKEFELTTLSDFKDYSPIDLITYAWDPSSGAIYPEDSSVVFDLDASIVRMGPTFAFPFANLQDIAWRMSVDKPYSGVLTNQFVSEPLWMLENEIRYYDIFAEESTFYDISTNLDILIEQGYLRDASNDNWTDSEAYHIYPDPAGSGFYIMESSVGQQQFFSGYTVFSPVLDGSSLLQYKVDDNYMVPLLSFKNYRYTDVSGNTYTLPQDKLFYLDIIDGKIAMDASIQTPDPSVVIHTTQYINFNYDTSLDEQQITLNVVYDSGRMQLFQYDPSIYYYYYNELNQNPRPALILDNSIYKMWVNHIGDYDIEIFGWDGDNVLYNNTYKEGDGDYEVWTRFPTICSYIDTSINGTTEFDCSSLTQEDVSINYIGENLKPIYDRFIPLAGLSVEFDSSTRAYINVPSITFFQDIPEPNTYAKFINITERVVNVNSTTDIDIDPDFVTFNQDDSINIVKFDKGKYEILDQQENWITSIASNNVTLGTAMPADYLVDNSTSLFLHNSTERAVSNATNDLVNQEISLDVSGYIFNDKQLVSLIIYDTDLDYKYGASFRVIETSGNTHTMEGNLPQFVIGDPSRYVVTAKHAFSTYSSNTIQIDSGVEITNNFNIYLNDIYNQQYYLDDTFVYMNILFDQEKINEQWYDPSDNLINSDFYGYKSAIEVDVSTLVILNALYDPSNYMLEQKNLWTIRRDDTNEILMKVFNNAVPYIFDASGTYNVQAEAYDLYGNLRAKMFEGLIKVNDV